MAGLSSGLNTFRSFTIYTKMHLHVVEDVFETVLTADLTGFFQEENILDGGMSAMEDFSSGLKLCVICQLENRKFLSIFKDFNALLFAQYL